MSEVVATSTPSVSIDDIDTSVNLQALLLAIGVNNKELESELFVGSIDMSLAYNALALDSAEDAYDHHIDSANNAFTSRMVGAGGSALSAASNGWGVRKAGQFNPEKGSPAFQASNKRSEADIGRLTQKRDALANTRLGSSEPTAGKGPTSTIGEGEVGPGETQTGPYLKDVTKADYDGWQADRKQLQQELDSPGNLSNEEIASKQQQVAKLDSKIGQYDELRGVETELGDVQSNQAHLLAREQQRQAEGSQMKWKAIGEVLKSACEVAAACLDRTAQVDTAKAGLDEAKHTWREKVADAFSQLANSHLSNNGSIDQYINNAVQTTQQVISELCKAN
jgi:hypothetical protein